MRLVGLTLIMASCATSAKPIVLATGEPGFVSYCDATKHKCLIQASRSCPTGYDVVEENRMGEFKSSTDVNPYFATSSQKSNTMMTMVFRCKKQTEPAH